MEYNQDIIPANNWNIVQSPGNGHCLVYSTTKSWNNQFYNHPQINTLGYLKRLDTNSTLITSSLVCFLYFCTLYYPLWLVIVYIPLIEIYNPRYVVYKPNILLLLIIILLLY